MLSASKRNTDGGSSTFARRFPSVVASPCLINMPPLVPWPLAVDTQKLSRIRSASALENGMVAAVRIDPAGEALTLTPIDRAFRRAAEMTKSSYVIGGAAPSMPADAGRAAFLLIVKMIALRERPPSRDRSRGVLG